MDHPGENDDGQEAECGSTSWRIMTGRASKAHGHSKPVAPTPPNPSDYITPHPQSGLIRTPIVPRPTKGRVTRSVYCQSPATAGKMKEVVPAPPFGFHSDGIASDTPHSSSKLGREKNGTRSGAKGSRSGIMIKDRGELTVETSSATAEESNLNESHDSHQEEIKMPSLVPSPSSATRTNDTKSTLAKRPTWDGPDRSDEDELLEQAAANVADVCCKEIRAHDAASSLVATQSASGDPLGGHDSLELLMEKGKRIRQIKR
jgi:hypothetical protein